MSKKDQHLGKDELRKSLERSVVNRQAMLERFGFIPHSILQLHRGALSRQMFRYQGEVPQRHVGKTQETKEKARRMREAGYWSRGTASGRAAGRGRPGATIMPAELVEFFIKYYAAPGQVYLDPFMGQGIQMQVAKLMGMHYYGYDCSEEFFRYIEMVRQKIDDGTTTIQITKGDSRYPTEIPDGIGDFSFHSPPYWDIEYYGDEPEQLGTGHTYEEFLQGMEDVARAWLPKFKPGGWHVVNVNDFRKGGEFVPYHADTISLFCRAGWKLRDTWIIHGLVGGLPKAFAVKWNMERIAPKVHEYALVFQCP